MRYCQKSGKQAHETRAKARAHLASLRRRHDYANAEVYQCHECHGWHVGRLNRKRLKEKNGN